MLALGVDPDLHSAGLSLVSHEPGKVPVVLWTGVALAPRSLKSYAAATALAWPSLPSFGNTSDILVVEGQRIYPHSQVRPEDLMHLAFAAGMAVGIYGPLAREVVVPLPQEWKGSVPKAVAHARILTRFNTPNPEVAAMIQGPHKSHVIDAIGLAIWGLGLPAAISKGRTIV